MDVKINSVSPLCHDWWLLLYKPSASPKHWVGHRCLLYACSGRCSILRFQDVISANCKQHVCVGVCGVCLDALGDLLGDLDWSPCFDSNCGQTKQAVHSFYHAVLYPLLFLVPLCAWLSSFHQYLIGCFVGHSVPWFAFSLPSLPTDRAGGQWGRLAGWLKKRHTLRQVGREADRQACNKTGRKWDRQTIWMYGRPVHRPKQTDKWVKIVFDKGD